MTVAPPLPSVYIFQATSPEDRPQLTITVTVDRERTCEGNFVAATTGMSTGFKVSAATGTFGDADISYDPDMSFDGSNNCFFPDGVILVDYNGFAFATPGDMHNLFYDGPDSTPVYRIENSDYVRRPYSGEIISSP